MPIACCSLGTVSKESARNVLKSSCGTKKVEIPRVNQCRRRDIWEDDAGNPREHQLKCSKQMYEEFVLDDERNRWRAHHVPTKKTEYLEVTFCPSILLLKMCEHIRRHFKALWELWKIVELARVAHVGFVG